MRLLPDPTPSSTTVSAQKARRVLVIANPAAGTLKQKRLRKAIATMEKLGCIVALRETTKPGDGTTIARTVDPAQVDIVVAAGGDGTINEVANGLAGRDVALGIIPLGTANVMAIETGIPTDPEKAAEVIATGLPRTIRIGEVRTEAATPLSGTRKFVMMAGAGFDAHVVDTVDLDLKRRAGKFAYVWNTLRKAADYAFPQCSVEVEAPDGTITRHDAATAVVCKGRYYGGPFIAAHDADIGAPVFHVVLLTRPGWLNVGRYGWGLMSGRLRAFSDVKILEAVRVRLEGDGALPLQGDGDTVAHLPVEIGLAKDPVTLIVPASSVGQGVTPMARAAAAG